MPSVNTESASQKAANPASFHLNFKVECMTVALPLEMIGLGAALQWMWTKTK